MKLRSELLIGIANEMMKEFGWSDMKWKQHIRRKGVIALTEDEMKAEIAYLEKRHREECSMLAAERDSWKARYDEILNNLSQQVQEKRIEFVLSETESKRVAKMLGID